MKRYVLIGCLLLLVTGSVAYAILDMRHTPGARIIPPEATRLLPDGEQWYYEVVLPYDLPDGFCVGLQVRRSSDPHDPNEGITISPRIPWVTQEDAEAVTSTSYSMNYGVEEPVTEARVAFQILDLNYYTPAEDLMTPLRICGGIQSQGSDSRMELKRDFFQGRIDGFTSRASLAKWIDGELCLMQFTTHDDSRLYYYDVIVVAKPAEEIPGLSAPDFGSEVRVRTFANN